MEVSFQDRAFIIIGVLWIAFSFIVGVRISVFTDVVLLLIFGYILLRLTQEIKRLADATEKIAENSNYSIEDD